MSENDKAVRPAGNALSADQVANVSGGADSCTTTVTIGVPGTGSIVSTYNDLGSALIGTYEGIVDATSYMIERLANTAK